ncbi:MAG: rhodanese-like domain-containing protein [Kofleriaceae bacterium]
MLIQLVLVLSTISLVACEHDPCAVSSEERATVKELTPREVADMLAANRAMTIIDANPREIFDEGHLPGARWLAGDDVQAVLPADRSSLVVFYCYSVACGASHAAAKSAIDAGWTQVARMPAGITGWKSAQLVVAK